MIVSTTDRYIEVLFDYSDIKDRARIDKLRTLGVFRYDNKSKKWRAPNNPSVLLELADTFSSDTINIDNRTKTDLIKFKQADKQRLEKISLLKNLRDNHTVDLEGYKFSDAYPPFQHQKEALTFLKHSNVCALFADCGVGKSYIILHWLRYLKEHHVPGLKALVIAPLRTLYSVWGEDIKKFTPDLSYVIFRDSTDEAKEVLAGKGEYDIYLINPDKARILEEELCRFKFDALILDESSKIKNPKAKTTKSILKIADSGPKYRAILSGTPAPNSPLEYWPQIRVLSQRVFGTNFYSFRDKFFIAEGFGGFSFKLNPYMEKEFTERLHSYSLRYKAEDCLDLPERTDQIIKVLLPPKVMEFYTAYHKDAIATLNIDSGRPETWASFHELDKLLKLRELTGGFLLKREEIIGDDGQISREETVRLIHEEKILALQDLLEELGNEQVLIWAHFQPEFEMLSKIPGVEIVNGTVNNKIAEDRISRFKNGQLRYLAAHPKSLAHGLTFVNCRYIIWYSVDWSSEHDYQANKRIHRAGQHRPTHHYYLIAHSYDGKDTIDSSILNALRGKYSSQLELLNSIVGTNYA